MRGLSSLVLRHYGDIDTLTAALRATPSLAWRDLVVITDVMRAATHRMFSLRMDLKGDDLAVMKRLDRECSKTYVGEALRDFTDALADHKVGRFCLVDAGDATVDELADLDVGLNQKREGRKTLGYAKVLPPTKIDTSFASNSIEFYF